MSADAGALDCVVVVPFHVGLHEDVLAARRLLEEVAATSRFVYLEKPMARTVEECDAIISAAVLPLP